MSALATPGHGSTSDGLTGERRGGVAPPVRVAVDKPLADGRTRVLSTTD